MVIGRELLFGATMMMSEQESRAALSVGGPMMRRRSKEWILPSSSTMGSSNMLGSGEVLSSSIFGTVNGGSGVASAPIVTSTLSSVTAASTNPTSSSQFIELIEMLLYCYLEYGGTQRSEQFRNLVEMYLCPIFEPVSRSTPSSNSATTVSSGSVPATAGVTAVSSSAPVMSCLDDMYGENFSMSSSLHMGSVLLSQGGINSVGGDNKLVGDFKRNSVGGAVGNVNCNMVCPVCYGILIDPVTVQCGHTYCKKCLQKEMSDQPCRQCNHFLTTGEVAQCKTNVLLGGLVEKWWPDQLQATGLRNEGNKLFEGKQIENALVTYTQALAIVPEDHLSLGNRSHCLLTAGKSEEALQDAEAAIKCCPIWAKGYFRKSAALISLGRYEEAFLSLTVCMYLMKLGSPKRSPSSSDDPARTQVVNEMIKILQKIFLQSTSGAVGSTLKRHNVGAENNIQYVPYPGARRRAGSGSSTAIGLNRQSWNDSFEYNSSGDELDHVVNTRHHHYHQYQNHTWKSNRSHHRQHRDQILQRSSSSPSVVEQLSLRMSRLFSRASRDLKSFENRLTTNGAQGIISMARLSSPHDVSSSDVECSLCYRLLFQPVSTECGHTFCRSCLDRCMDHNPSCPLCKTGLQSYLACRQHAVTDFLEVAIKTHLLKEYEERLSQHMEELNSVAHAEGKTLDVDIPIFVCTMAFPTVPCPLHVFEPRYRLMIRRCMENGTKRFGMCCFFSESENNYGEIGTLLDIRNIQYFADGRSVVDTVGCRRFKVVHKTVVDGYNAARIELLQDKPAHDDEIPALSKLHDKVFQEATEWLRSIGQVRRQRILAHFGPMPSAEQSWIGTPDGPSWAWWLLAILPLDSKAQLSILSMCSLQKRLECILKVLNFIKSRMSTGKE